MGGPRDQEETVRFLADSASGYSPLPPGAWQSPAPEPTREESFAPADGTVVTRDTGNMSGCYAVPPAVGEHTPVIRGVETDEQALPGVIAPENLGPAPKPFGPTLHPMRLPWRN